MGFNFVLIPIIIIFGIYSHNSQAEIDQKSLNQLNSELSLYYEIKARENPNKKNDQEIIKDRNQAFLQTMKNKVSAEEYKKIEKEILYFQNTDRNEINKSYLTKTKLNEKKQLNKQSKETLDNLISAATKRMVKGFDLQKTIASNRRKPVLNNADISLKPNVKNERLNIINNKKIASSSISIQNKENLSQDEQIIKDVIQSSELRSERFKPNEDDSLFDTVTKAYFRNYHRIIDGTKKE